ncbi:MAG: hypothetical protein LBH13_09935, partial [Cellulomonadaceae bacterium]|nr:hypothetical protein [Cellulomonadaceae bacterium]
MFGRRSSGRRARRIRGGYGVVAVLVALGVFAGVGVGGAGVASAAVSPVVGGVDAAVVASERLAGAASVYGAAQVKVEALGSSRKVVDEVAVTGVEFARQARELAVTGVGSDVAVRASRFAAGGVAAAVAEAREFAGVLAKLAATNTISTSSSSDVSATNVADHAASSSLRVVPAAAQVTEFGFSAFVANSGGQDAVDACTGGLTNYTPVADYLGIPDFVMHNHCGGAPILSLSPGQTVKIDDTVYTVTATMDVQQHDGADVITDFAQGSDALLQTCYNNGSSAMYVVALQL